MIAKTKHSIIWQIRASPMAETRIKVKLSEQFNGCPFQGSIYELSECAITKVGCRVRDLLKPSAPNDCPLRQGPVIVEADDG